MSHAHPRPEPAFSMIEVIVAMVIAAILLTLFVAGFQRVRVMSARHHAAAVARAYDEGVRSFSRDHDGRPPDPQRPTPEWPSAQAVAGPLDTMRSSTGTPSPYLGRNLPDAAREGEVGVQVGRTDGAAAGTSGRRSGITYRYDRTAATYDITAQVDEWTCIVGSSVRAKATGAVRC